MKIWHALLIAVAIMAFVPRLSVKRGLLFLLIFWTVTGCKRDADIIVDGVEKSPSLLAQSRVILGDNR